MWWTMTTPPEAGGSSAGISGSHRSVDPPTLPLDLSEDEIWLADLHLDAGALVLPDSPLMDVRATGHGAGPDQAV